MTQSTDLTAIWWAGVTAVQGCASVVQAIDDQKVPQPDYVIAVGKAASSMAKAAHLAFGAVPMLVVTKYSHSEDAPPHARVIESAHPVPDEASLAAGKALLDVIRSATADMHLLCLVSGGASSLAEVLPSKMTLDDLANHTAALLGSGQDIHAMNKRRKEFSRIKGGKLLAEFSGAQVTTLAISDVEGDDLATIGSGIGDVPNDCAFEFASHIVASNKIARMAAEDAIDGQAISNVETLYEDVAVLAPKIARTLIASSKGIHIMGGEPTIVLPPNPGLGGRNMALALAIAREIRGVEGIRVLVAGTDGTDGPTDAAGALIDGSTWDDSAEDAILRANAYPWLDAKGALFRSGPTGTNVMDLLIAECGAD